MRNGNKKGWEETLCVCKIVDRDTDSQTNYCSQLKKTNITSLLVKLESTSLLFDPSNSYNCSLSSSPLFNEQLHSERATV